MKVISSILNLRELILIKQHSIIYVDMAQQPLRLLHLCCGSFMVLITQMYLMQSNYFVAQCEFKNVQVSWSVIQEFTVEAGSQPPNMLLPVDSGAQLLLSDQWECNWGCLLYYVAATKCGEWGPSRGLAAPPYVSLRYAGKVCAVCLFWILYVYDALISAPSQLVEFLHLMVFVSILCLQDSRDKMLMTEVLLVQYTVNSVSEAKSCFMFPSQGWVCVWFLVGLCWYTYVCISVLLCGIWIHSPNEFVGMCMCAASMFTSALLAVDYTPQGPAAV